MTIEATWRADSGSSVCDLANGHARWQADLDAPMGNPEIPNPHDLLDSALAACTTLTVQIYAKRKGYAVEGVRVTVKHEETPGSYKLVRTVELQGDLPSDVREDLLRVANKCPVHKALSATITIETTLEG
ncbi:MULTISPECIES: OsmC family protein [unclassified Cupriavidus]|uniref:OsmC family protein n=1 Tax=unclassified Cupriavidus TaxID=2640874 RepID=UPI0010F93F63|nr:MULTISPECIES: OsmC family protein [unclassified Cupriavidus]MWL90685.1 OsmC family peroxiredoxin [Cupriavidus sp. SW-Y-13]